jgi:vacuolar-type H+-ATPase subunit E/Vma4
METNTVKELKLVADIRRDAQAEAEKIKTEAIAQARDRQAQYERQIDEARAEGNRTAAVQTEAVKKTLQAAFTVEMRRLALRARDLTLKRVLDRTEAKLGEFIKRKDYRDLLAALIAEAAIGLGADVAEVNASPEELALIDNALLGQAADKVKMLVLRTVTLKKSAAAPLLLQGVVLSSVDGKTAYNNQIQTRLLRRQGEIRKLIYDRLKMDS